LSPGFPHENKGVFLFFPIKPCVKWLNGNDVCLDKVLYTKLIFYNRPNYHFTLTFQQTMFAKFINF